MNTNHPGFLTPAFPSPGFGTNMARSRILLGLVLALVGVVLETFGFAAGFLILPGLVADSSLFRVEAGTAVGTFGGILMAVGLFLLFFSVAQVRPATRPWTLGAAVTLLVAGAFGAVFRVWYFLALSSVITGGSSQPAIGNAIGTMNTVAWFQAVVGLVATVATIVGLFGLAKPLVSA